MNADDWLTRHGLLVLADRLPEVRTMLAEATSRERAEQGTGDTELMRLCAVQLFMVGDVDDALLVWRAKTASMDADAGIEVSLLCGAGLEATKAHLARLDTEEATAALARLTQVEQTGQLQDFDVSKEIETYREYYSP